MFSPFEKALLMKKLLAFCIFSLLISSSCSKEAKCNRICAIEGCPYTECEYVKWGGRTYAIQGCKECDSLGYSDVGKVNELIADVRFDPEYYESKKEFIDSIYENARLDIKTSGFSQWLKS